MTRKELCELVQFRLAGGDPTDDFPITLSEINLWLDHGIAAAAMKNYADGVNLDGIEFIGDAYYTTFKNLALSADAVSGYYKATLPAMPVSVPRGYDISSVYLQGQSSYSSTPMVRTNPQHMDYHFDLPAPKNAVFWWVEGNTLYVRPGATNVAGVSVAVRMIGSAGSRSLADQLLVPNDAVPQVVEYVLRHFLQTDQLPKDTMNDGVNVK